jgi:DNA repair protein RecO (recombination protein O)
MAQGTYHDQAIVLCKTPLKETDLIVTLLARDGRRLKAVAKGARKPTSSFAARLELFCEVDLLCATGRNLDIVKEARIVDAHRGVRDGMERSLAAAPMVDLMARLAQPDLSHPSFYPMTSSALTHLDRATPAQALALSAAHLLKAFSFGGFRPNFDECVGCGSHVDLDGADPSDMMPFSVREGGVLCPRCTAFNESRQVLVETLQWARFLLMSTFDAIMAEDVPMHASFAVLHLCQDWTQEHIGARSKPLDFLFTCGMF